MSTTHPRLATVCTAQRRGPNRPTEDRIFTTDTAVIVLDGASQPEPGERDGGWLADTLGRDLADRLTQPGADLAHVLRDGIAAVAARHDLHPGTAPSTTVSIVRWDPDRVDVLVLGDSPVIAVDRGGAVREVRDDRLRRVAVGQRAQHAVGGFDGEQRDEWRRLVDAERAHRNRDGGYWIAEAVPEAADHAIRASWRRKELAAVLAMTDGVSAGVDRYGVPPDWTTAAAVARDDPARLVDLIHHTEDDDPDGRRWPRSKRHDDKALAVIEFDHL